MTAAEIYQIAMEHSAVMSPLTNIRWVEMPPYGGMWVPGKDGPVSVMDALILERAQAVEGYTQAAIAATGWSSGSVASFQTIMLLGHPIHETPHVAHELQRWKGIITGLELYDLVKNRQTMGGCDE